MEYGKGYTIGFATAVCLVCAVIVSSAAVGLRGRQEANAVLDRQKKVLLVAGLMEEGEAMDAAEVQKRFEDSIKAVVVNLKSGLPAKGVDPASFDQVAATKEPSTSQKAPANAAKVKRLPNNALIYQVLKDGKLDMVVLPIEGKGLWSTLYGFLALDKDGDTIRGLTFYQHGETPGLGGEVDNPRWKAVWKGRKAYDAKGNPAIDIIKGPAPSAKEAPHKIDGLSGATLTCNGVEALVRFWIGENGFKNTITHIKKTGAVL
ncbi:MAG: Na(+)-translocating NADH-quinone reductase subunit C [Planctomycetota bacterium]|nr:MAG: Na(+)-translocating NADH-quinone reductase subunit C [Planctomycetota bacterium]